MKTIYHQLQSQLIDYGLNPQDWRLEETQLPVSPGRRNLIRSIKIQNQKDPEFYFTGEAQIKSLTASLKKKALWHSIRLASL
jgi:hypothetical protein